MLDDDIPWLASFEPLERRSARLLWRDGRSVVLDLLPALSSRRVFADVLANDDTFQRGTVDQAEHGNCIHWPGGADLSALWIERLGKEQGVM